MEWHEKYRTDDWWEDPAQWSAMMIEWLQGKLDTIPGHRGPPSDETHQIRDELIRMNQVGFITAGSQPGLDSPRLRQRAYVTGCAPAPLAHRWAACALSAGLHAWVWSTYGYLTNEQWMAEFDLINPQHRLPVTMRDGDEFTWVPIGLPNEFGLQRDDYLQLAIIDPTWGPSTKLFTGEIITNPKKEGNTWPT